ncbi:5884_t:CDS:2 [Racocetra fulgida]|uniref:5884_t:CDS:1 n=1 Tax=Racocetra fulgida TaxID=60492 RepID=A0A9N8WJS4_9GLOM|nr:5884_t:CDS:2 [Racocetra fulgida]
MNTETPNNTSNSKDSIVEQLLALFPDADPGYLRNCIEFYQDNHVERISEKICNQNMGHYPIKPDNCSSANCTKAKNIYLKQLNDLFPECDVGFLREKLCRFDHSHVQQVTETLLKMDKSSEGYPRRPNPFVIEPWELIRSPDYIKAVRYRLYNDFPDTWKSTVKAVLAENNFDYAKSFAKIRDLTTNNWWNSIFSVFRRKMCKEVENTELEEEVHRMQKHRLEEQSKADYEVARQINFMEYTKNDQLITCGCCYGDCPFEDLASCNEGHLFCKECINHFVQEGLFGQGSLRGKQVNCIEPGGCNGYFTEDQLKATLLSDVFKHYVESLIEHSLKQANLSLVQCPFCSYCEIDDDSPFNQLKIPKSAVIAISIPLAILPFFSSFENIISALKVATIFVLPQITLWMLGVFPLRTFLDDFENIVKKCQNPDCSKSSCMLCNRECRPFHKCYEQEQDSLRLFVERAMAEAVKRTKCTKCDLYKTEDEDKVIKEAAAKARAEFIKTHPEAREANLLQNAAIGPVEKLFREMVEKTIEKIVDYLIP